MKVTNEMEGDVELEGVVFCRNILGVFERGSALALQAPAFCALHSGAAT